MKKIISAILILSTLMSCFVFTASAENSIISDEGRLPFDDIKQSYWFYEAAEFCYANGIIKGMDKYTFGATVGLTRDLTPTLSAAGKLIVIATMYLGRIGPISLVIAFNTKRKRKNIIKNPAEEISVG